LPQRDRYFIRLLASGPIMPLFVAPTPAVAGVPPEFTHLDALSTTSYDDLEYSEPSVQLIDLVRSGRLPHIGWAIPRPQSASLLGDELSNAEFVFSTAGLRQVSSTTTAPPVPDAIAFANALFVTILPALIDRPKALAQWLALGRTALSIARKHSWEVAAAHLERVLPSRIRQAKPFADVAPGDLNPLIMARAASGAAAASAAASGSAPRQPPLGQGPVSVHQTCNAWNFKVCPRSACPFPHVCCFRAGRGCTGEHRGATCVFNPQGPAKSYKGFSPRSYGNRGGPGGGGSGGGGYGSARSVSSAAGSSPAAKSAM
jgi:hypothetical protein